MTNTEILILVVLLAVLNGGAWAYITIKWKLQTTLGWLLQNLSALVLGLLIWYLGACK